MAFKKSTSLSQRLLPWLGLALLVIGADQLSKFSMTRHFQYGDIKPITDYFSLILTYNKGAAFSFLANAGGWQHHFFTAIGIGASLFIIYLLARHGSQKMFCFALALILGGALGNVIDRLLHGYVVDFLLVHYRNWNWPAFNLADSAIVGGAALLLLDELRRVRKSK